MPSALLVDYIRVCRLVYGGLLTSCGFEVVTVETGQEAIDLVSAGNEFDVIVMNVNTPDINGTEGIETTRILRSMNASNLLVGILLNYDLEREYSTFIEAGLDVCFPTPLNIAKIGLIVHLLDIDSSSDD